MEKEKRIKVQMNNLDIVGKILVEEANIIKEFMDSKKVIENTDVEAQKAQLKNLIVALGVCASYFSSKVEGLEKELKKDEKTKELS